MASDLPSLPRDYDTDRSREPADDYDLYEWDADDYEDGDRDCSICGGEPDMQECDDPLQCCDPQCDGTWHPCQACNGTGLASQQWMW